MEWEMRNIRFDFGRGYRFSGMAPGRDQLERFQEGERREYPEKIQGCQVTIYTGGTYEKVVRLSKSIPTFDSGDREYDSWHDLYLGTTRERTVQALYCTGGYRVAKAVFFGKVLGVPGEVGELL